MENLDNSQFAEFILAHGKTISYAGEDFAYYQPNLLHQLKTLGATIKDLGDYAKTKTQENIDGPHILIIDDRDGPTNYCEVEWCTVFIIPDGDIMNPVVHGDTLHNHGTPWRNHDNYNNQQYMWLNNRWQRFGNYGKMLKPWSHDADKLFQHQILGVHPDLVLYWDKIYPVYAGASFENVLYRIPILESVRMIEKAISKGKDKIIFSNADEALQPHSIHMAHRIIDLVGHMPFNSWYMLTATLDGTQSYLDLCNILEIEPKMNILSGYRFENVIKDSMYMGHPERSQDFTEHPHWKGREYKIGKRNKKLLCFNRMPRWQRARMVGFLFEHDLIKDSFVSFDISINAEMMNTKKAWDLKNNPDIDEEFKEDRYISNIYKNYDALPLVLNRTVDRDNPVDINDDDLQYFDNSYFSVVNETNFYHCLDDKGHKPISCVHTDGVFISEKLYKPIAHRHPFVVAGINRTLEYLRKAGYKTFDGIINEEYDQIEDDELRLQALEEEVLRLANLTDDEWLVLQEKLKPIIDYNYKHLLRIKKLNTTDFDIKEVLG